MSSQASVSSKGKNKSILVTGGCGFIGSHTCVVLLEKGYDVVVVDNFVNSSPKALERVQQITKKNVILVELDLVKNYEELRKLCVKHTFTSCIHFAGLKAVGESVKKPLEYYRNNLVSTLNLLQCLEEGNCTSIIFSSSATVYGMAVCPVSEKAGAGAGITNPYGRTKFMIEEILKDYVSANAKWRAVILRYFNPIGAHPSGLIGEDPSGIPNNLMPYVCQVASGRRPFLNVFGNDYDTVDGTGVRDYIHVMDLADGHVAALENDILDVSKKGTSVYNLGTGKGSSVMEVIKAMEAAVGRTLDYKIVDRRPGDVAILFADVSKAKTNLGWTAGKTINDACRDSWKWQKGNPYGYRPKPESEEEKSDGNETSKQAKAKRPKL